MKNRIEFEIDEATEIIVNAIKSDERLRVWTLIELDMLIPEEVKPRIKSLIIKEGDE